MSETMKIPGNIGDLFEQVQQLQQNLTGAKQELEKQQIEVSVGGGMVTVRMTGGQIVTGITIDPKVIDPNDREMLQDLVLAAVNEAVRKSRAMMKDELSKVTGGLPIPGLFGT